MAPAVGVPVYFTTALPAKPALRIQQDGTGKILSIFDGATEVWTMEDGGNLGYLNSNPDFPIDMLLAAISGREAALRVKVDDSGDDAFYIANNTTANGRFVPEFLGHRASDAVGAGMILAASLLDTLDTGSAPVMVLQTKKTNGDPVNGTLAAIATRPLLIIRNFNTDVVNILANGDVGIGTDAPAGKLHIDQSSTTAAKPVLVLDQADLSEEMIEFTATVGAGNPIQAVGVLSFTGTHYLRVSITGVGYKYLRLGDLS